MTKINDNGIDRNMTAAELSDYEAWAAVAQAEAEAQEQDATARAAARQNAIQKLANLGLTANEIAALVGQ